jgi:hypothetical protein
MATLAMLSGAVPVLERVTCCGALEVPTVCEPKVRLVGERVTAGAGVAPVPVNAT